MNDLSLMETSRALVGAGKQRRDFLDFVVDGGGLYRRVLAAGLDLVSPLWVRHELARAGALSALAQLRGEEPGATDLGGRVVLYSCAECGDMGCGGLTVDLSVTARTVSWSGWAYQNNYDPEVSDAGLESFNTLVFDRAAYLASLDVAREVILAEV